MTQTIDETSASRRDLLKWGGVIAAGGAIFIPALPDNARAQSGNPTPGGTLIYARTTEAPHINPLQGGLAGHRVLAVVYDSLARLEANLEIGPGLAESWEIQEDITYIFHLREGVTWHNGRNFEAEDVKISFEWIMNPENAGSRRGDLEIVESIEVVDPLTVQFNLSGPNGGFLALLADMFTAIVPRELLVDGGDARTTAIGTGPFKLESWTPDSEMRLVRNDAYYGEGLPLLDELRIQIIPAEDSIIAGLRGSTVDQTTLEDNKTSLLVRGQSDLLVQQSPRLGMEFVIINCSIPPFDNELVRQALAYAIDRQEILDGALLGLGRLTGPLPEAMENWSVPVDQFSTYSRDVDRAKALLAEAGFPDGFSSQLMVIPTFPTFVASAQIIANQVRDAGIDLEIVQVEYGIWLDRLNVTRDMPLTLNLTQGFADPDAYLYGRFSSTGTNQPNWNEPEVDALLAAGRAATDPEERRAIYTELQHLLADVKVPYLWLYSADLIDISQNRVQGYEQHPTSFLFGMASTWLQA